ncbi:aminotransferase class IV [Hyphococcus formosus]|uniref:aminotransferase class IV n=1 Tax=Hyphococcus formosus TaxID=3143534 RepID=UPI00398A9C2D
MTIYFSGQYLDDPTSINVADRGFLLGDGIFETILLRDGQPAFFSAHIARLTAGAAALGIDVKFTETEIAKAITDLAERNGAKKGAASCRITLTRGVGARGLSAEDANEPTLLVTVSPYKGTGGESLRLMVARASRAERSISARYKTLNYLDNVLAREEARAAKMDDAIMLNHAGRVACASAANVFVIREDGEVVTPPVREGALSGIVRNVLLQTANNAGLAVVEAEIDRHELKKSAIILTNSLIGLRLATIKSGEVSASAQKIFDKLKSCYENALRDDLKMRAGH